MDQIKEIIKHENRLLDLIAKANPSQEQIQELGIFERELHAGCGKWDSFIAFTSWAIPSARGKQNPNKGQRRA